MPPELRAALQPTRLALLDADANDPEILPAIIAQIKVAPPSKATTRPFAPFAPSFWTPERLYLRLRQKL